MILSTEYKNIINKLFQIDKEKEDEIFTLIELYNLEKEILKIGKYYQNLPKLDSISHSDIKSRIYGIKQKSEKIEIIPILTSATKIISTNQELEQDLKNELVLIVKTKKEDISKLSILNNVNEIFGEYIRDKPIQFVVEKDTKEHIYSKEDHLLF